MTIIVTIYIDNIISHTSIEAKDAITEIVHYRQLIIKFKTNQR